ncbi:MAG: hypothetical protein LBK12_06860 [Odoribacteraceae bacterium]|nr:hypothetical protein [Odoribacteraceae bacterium]
MKTNAFIAFSGDIYTVNFALNPGAPASRETRGACRSVISRLLVSFSRLPATLSR